MTIEVGMPAALLTSIATSGATAFLIIMAMTFRLILPRMLFARNARASMKSGMDVLCTAAPFKITRRRRHIPYPRVARPRDRGVFP
jgi:hypothetical protein